MGKFQKSLASVEAHALGALAIKDVLDNSGIDPAQVDEVIFANLFNYNWANMARVAWLEADLPVEVPGIQVDRQCGSSLTAIALAAMTIETGNADIILTGGVESYSWQPFMIARPAMPFPRSLNFMEYMASVAKRGNAPMIMTAENIAAKYGITRTECDAFALKSHQNATEAWRKGYFNGHVFSVSAPQRKGEPKVVTMDECVRPDTSMEALARLKPVLKTDGVVTAGNSSPMNDGSTASLLMSRSKAEALGLLPMATVTAYASVGCEPDYMGLGPVFAIRKLLKKVNRNIDDIDLYEVNEAFAAQTLACIKELELPMDKLNVNGGAIAIGHPNAASGGILAARILHEMQRRDAKSGIVSFCCGGGQGIAVLFER